MNSSVVMVYIKVISWRTHLVRWRCREVAAPNALVTEERLSLELIGYILVTHTLTGFGKQLLISQTKNYSYKVLVFVRR